MTKDSESIERIVGFLKENKLLSSQQAKMLERPGQSNKFPVSVCINCIKEHLNELSEMKIEDAASESLFRVVSDEMRLLSMLNDADTISRVLFGAGVVGTDYNVNHASKVTPLESNLSYPFIISTERGDLFMKYNSPLGNKYISRNDPKEAVFQNLLAEAVLSEKLGAEFVTKSLYPSLSIAENKRNADDSSSELERIRERAIIQPSYSPEYILLSESDDLSLIGKVTGSLVARIYNKTAGFRWSGLLEKYKNEVRDRTWDEFEEWLNKQSWVKKRYDIIMDTDNSDLKPFIDEAKGFNLDWNSAVVKSHMFWNKDRCLGTPDMRPKNTFYNNLKGARIFDFDFLAVQEPTFFAAMVMYTCVKDATDRSISSSDRLTEIASNYLDGFTAGLEKSRHDNCFKDNIKQYFAFIAIARYLPDYIGGLATYETMESVFNAAKRILVM